MRLLLLVLLLSSRVLAKEITVDIPFPGGVERIKFDDSKISGVEIQRIFEELDTGLSGTYGYPLPAPLRLCTDDDTRYAPCGTGDIHDPNFLHNAEVNIQISAQRLQELKESTFPDELKPVQAYISAFFASLLRVQKCRLDYYKNWNAGVLITCDALSKAEACDGIVAKLEAAKDHSAKYELTWHDWPNCVLDSTNKQLGSYPHNDWNKFLQAYGITEQEITNDD